MKNVKYQRPSGALRAPCLPKNRKYQKSKTKNQNQSAGALRAPVCLENEGRAAEPSGRHRLNFSIKRGIIISTAFIWCAVALRSCPSARQAAGLPACLSCVWVSLRLPRSAAAVPPGLMPRRPSQLLHVFFPGARRQGNLFTVRQSR